MTSSQAQTRCQQLIQRLNELEGCLTQIIRASEFCFKSQIEVKELWHIARFETEHNITAEQVTHLVRIENKVNQFLKEAKQ